MRYWDSLGMDAQAVMREAKRQLENIELEPEPVLQGRRALLNSPAYACTQPVDKIADHTTPNRRKSTCRSATGRSSQDQLTTATKGI